MKRTVVIGVLSALVAAAAAFILGRASSDSAGDSTPTRELVTSDGHEDRSGMARRSAVAGAGHVHAIAHLPGGELLLGAHDGLFRSSDGGRSWNKVDPQGDLGATDFMSLVVHPTERVVFAGGHGLGVVKSSDGGATWVRSDRGIDGTDIHALAMNERQPNYLFAYSTGHGVYRSTDGGASWNRLDDGPDNPGVRSFAYMAVQTDMDRSMGSDNWGLLFAGTADGIYDSYSCFCGWRPTTDRFNGATVYSLATGHRDLRTMYAGTTDGLWKSPDEGKSWERLGGISGRIAAVAVDPSDRRRAMAVSEAGQVFHTIDDGRTWAPL